MNLRQERNDKEARALVAMLLRLARAAIQPET